jgi:site-specific DNA-cytosine methylase
MLNVDSTEEQRVISLCTGYGGIELGLKRVSPIFRTVCYVEIEAYAVANLVAKIEEGKLDSAPIWTNLKTFPAQGFRGKVHGITGGYPCQPDSLALSDKRLKNADERWLWPYFERIIKTIRPLWCFFENVEGHLTGGFPEVYRSLRLMGYETSAGLYTAVECGANHERTRLFAYARSSGLEGENQFEAIKKEKKDAARLSKRGWWYSKPNICRVDDGTTSRVDRIRLLGNGVVPQCAEKAFINLLALFEGKDEQGY